MKKLGVIVWILANIVFALLPPLATHAAGERERIAVLAARVRWGLSQRPEMPDAPPVERGTRRAERGTEEELGLPIGDSSPFSSAFRVPRSALESSASLKVLTPVGAVAVSEPYDVTVYTAPWCGPCESAKKRDKDGNADVTLRWIESKPPVGIPELYPTYVWTDVHGGLRYVHGVQTLDRLQALVERNDPAPRRVVTNTSASAVGGVIQTGGRIRWMLSLWSDRLGPDAAVSLKWDRSGLQDLNATKLMHGDKWTPRMVGGSFGHVSISTTSNQLPLGLHELSFVYKLPDDGHFTIDADPLTLALSGASELEQTRAAKGVLKAYGFLDPVSIGFDVYELFAILNQILNPQIDVGMPGAVNLTAAMSGSNKLIVTFANDLPTIHVDVWFKFDLPVQAIEITPVNVHVQFDAKSQRRNWIKIESRDFPVSD